MARLLHLDLNSLVLINLVLLLLFNYYLTRKKIKVRNIYLAPGFCPPHWRRSDGIDHVTAYRRVCSHHGRHQESESQGKPEARYLLPRPTLSDLAGPLYFTSERIHSVPEQCHQLGNTHKSMSQYSSFPILILTSLHSACDTGDEGTLGSQGNEGALHTRSLCFLLDCEELCPLSMTQESRIFLKAFMKLQHIFLLACEQDKISGPSYFLDSCNIYTEMTFSGKYLPMQQESLEDVSGGLNDTKWRL